jgi:hypothetical protein
MDGDRLVPGEWALCWLNVDGESLPGKIHTWERRDGVWLAHVFYHRGIGLQHITTASADRVRPREWVWPAHWGPAPAADDDRQTLG